MPTLRERLALAKKVVVGQYDEQSAQRAFGLLTGIYPAARGEPPQRGTLERLDGYNTMPWLRACADRVASAMASVQWQLFYERRNGQAVKNRTWQRGDLATRKAIRKQLQADDALVPVGEHPLIDSLLEGGNGFLSGHSIRKVTQLYMDLAGECYWIKERDRLGTPVRVWPIPAYWVIGTPTPSHRFFRVAFRAWIGDIPDTEILWMANVNPVQPYGRGTGLAGSLADELETDEYASRFLKQFFYNDATPPFIVSPKGTDATSVLSEADTRRLEASWLSKLQGYWRAHKPLFASRAVDITVIEKDLRNLQMIQIRDHERNVVIQTFGLPPEMLGVLEHSNRSTIDSADYLFSKFVTIPRLEFLRAELQMKLVPEYDARLVLDYVSPVSEDHAAELAAATVAPWALTRNEWRARMGEPPEPNGNVYLQPLLLQAVSADAAIPAAGHQPPLEENPDEVLPPSDEKRFAVVPQMNEAEVRALIDAALQRERREPSQINVQPTINIPRQPDVIVNVAAPPPAEVHVAAPPPAEVHVAAPTIHLAAQPSPDVHVHVPEQSAPVVHVAAPDVQITMPSPPPTTKTVTKTVERDQYDRITRIVEYHADVPDPPQE